MPPLTIQQAFDLGLQHHRAGRLREAEQLYRHVLTQQPEHPEALHLLGLMAHQAGRNDIAVDLIGRAVALKPADAEAQCNFGNVLNSLGRFDEAIAACRRALAVRSNFPEAANNLGIALKGQGKIEEAVASFRQAVGLRTNYAEAYSNFGNALSDLGQFESAAAACRRAMARRPDFPEAGNNLGVALKGMGKIDDAIASFRQALVLRPKYAEAYSNLGNALREKRELDEALAALRTAIALDPKLPEAHANLGNVLRDQGQLDQAIAAFRQAVALRPSFHQADSNLLYTLHFHPGYTAGQIAEEHHRWNRQHAEPLRKLIQAHPNDRGPDRRLRVGYVSPHFRSHATTFFTYPLLRAHDHKEFEIYCYADASRNDELTKKLKDLADVWRPVAGKTDEQIAEVIRRDRIDILIDLTMHMSDGRPLLFARKPAPVQAAWLAYPGATGLAVMDYHLTDPYLEPPGLSDANYSEVSFRLADTVLCYDPLTTLPAVNASPLQSNGFITFGSLNNFCKTNDQVLKMWSGALAATAESRLLVLSPKGSHRRRLEDFAAAAGIDKGRIEWLDYQPRPQYLEYYHRIDVVLDAWPYNGETTSLDGLWMGVPMVTLCGQTAPSRAGLCYHTHLGLTDLVAQTPQEYIDIAARLAGDLPRLAELRSTLRSRLERSPLMNAPKFAREVESAYRQMWRRWCDSPKSQTDPLAALPPEGR